MKKLETLEFYLRLKKDLEKLENLKILYTHDCYNSIHDLIEEHLENLEAINLLKIVFNTGTHNGNVIYTEGTKNEDFLSIIESYVSFNKEDFQTFDYHELLKEETENEISENYYPINGGEYYIYSVYSCDKLTFLNYFYNVHLKEA